MTGELAYYQMLIYAGINADMIDSEQSDRRQALGQFLKRQRQAMSPPAGGRRRTAGWRREEVADAAGISTTWYTWLEQGRDIQMSDHALARLGRALSLDGAQRRYLFELARPAAPVPVAAVDPQVLRFVDGLSPLPAYVLDRGWRIVGANEAARRVLLLGPGEESLIEKMFLDLAWRTLFEDWPTIAASAVAQYRAAVGGRPEYRAEVDSLVARSAEFAALWAAGEVRGAPVWEKVLLHPDLGRVAMRYASLSLDGPEGLTVSIYTPADAAACRAIAAA